MPKFHQEKQKKKSEIINTKDTSSLNANAPLVMENPTQINTNSPANNLESMAGNSEDTKELDFSEISDSLMETLPEQMRSMSPEALKTFFNMQNESQREDYYSEKTLSEVVKDLRNHTNLLPGEEYKNFKKTALDFEEYVSSGEFDIVVYSSKFSSTIEAVTRYIDTHSKAKSIWGKKRLNMAKSILSKMEKTMNPVTFFAGQFKEYGAVINMDSKESIKEDAGNINIIKAPDYIDIAKNESVVGNIVSDNVGSFLNAHEIIEKSSVIDTFVSSSKLLDNQKETAKNLSNEIKTATKDKEDGKDITDLQVIKSMVLGTFSTKTKRIKDELNSLYKGEEDIKKYHDSIRDLKNAADLAKEKYGKSANNIKELSSKIEEFKDQESYKKYVKDKETDIKKHEEKINELNKQKKEFEKRLEDITSPYSTYNQNIENAKNYSKESEKVYVLSKIKEGDFTVRLEEYNNGERLDLLDIETTISEIEKAFGEKIFSEDTIDYEEHYNTITQEYDDLYEEWNNILDSLDDSIDVDELVESDPKLKELSEDIQDYEEGIEATEEALKNSKAEDLKKYAENNLEAAQAALDDLVGNLTITYQSAVNVADYEIKERKRKIDEEQRAIKDIHDQINNYEDLKDLNEKLVIAQREGEESKLLYEKNEKEIERLNKEISVIESAIAGKEQFDNDVNKLSLINDALAHFFNCSEMIAKDSDVKIDNYNDILKELSNSKLNEETFKANLSMMIKGYASSNGDEYHVSLTESDNDTISKIVGSVWSLYNDLSKFIL